MGIPGLRSLGVVVPNPSINQVRGYTRSNPSSFFNTTQIRSRVSHCTLGPELRSRRCSEGRDLGEMYAVHPCNTLDKISHMHPGRHRVIKRTTVCESRPLPLCGYLVRKVMYTQTVQPKMLHSQGGGYLVPSATRTNIQ